MRRKARSSSPEPGKRSSRRRRKLRLLTKGGDLQKRRFQYPSLRLWILGCEEDSLQRRYLRSTTFESAKENLSDFDTKVLESEATLNRVSKA